MENNKLTNTRLIFRIINEELDHFKSCTPAGKVTQVHKLKTINEELCDLVIDIVKENERLKSIANATI